MTKENDTFFSEENEAKSNWAKFEQIGDSVKGTFVGRTRKEAQENFPAQVVYELLATDGSYWNVGFNESKIFIHNRMRNVKLGQIVGFKFTEEVPSKTKGYANAKTILVYVGGMDENYQPNEMQDIVETTPEEEKAPFEE